MKSALASQRFWLILATCAIAGLALWLLAVAGTVNAQREAAYQRCVGSIPLTRKFNRYLAGTNDMAATLVRDAKAGKDATAPGDPLYQLRVDVLRRRRVAAGKIAAIQRLPVPTRELCEKLR